MEPLAWELGMLPLDQLDLMFFENYKFFTVVEKISHCTPASTVAYVLMIVGKKRCCITPIMNLIPSLSSKNCEES